MSIAPLVIRANLAAGVDLSGKATRCTLLAMDDPEMMSRAVATATRELETAKSYARELPVAPSAADLWQVVRSELAPFVFDDLTIRLVPVRPSKPQPWLPLPVKIEVVGVMNAPPGSEGWTAPRYFSHWFWYPGRNAVFCAATRELVIVQLSAMVECIATGCTPLTMKTDQSGSYPCELAAIGLPVHMESPQAALVPVLPPLAAWVPGSVRRLVARQVAQRLRDEAALRFPPQPVDNPVDNPVI